MSVWWREHRLKLLGALLAVVIAGYGWVLLNIQHDNARQDGIDRARTEQVEDILAQVADILARIDASRVDASLESCQRGNDLRRDLRESVAELASNVGIINYFAERFADIDCSTVVPATQPTISPTTEEP